jgi:hypothetical protein
MYYYSEHTKEKYYLIKKIHNIYSTFVRSEELFFINNDHI